MYTVIVNRLTPMISMITKSNNKKHFIPSPGGQDPYVTKIEIVWMATDTKQVLKGCQAVENKIGVINHCLINLICMLFLRL